jgi:hypothetical protein
MCGVVLLLLLHQKAIRCTYGVVLLVDAIAQGFGMYVWCGIGGSGNNGM